MEGQKNIMLRFKDERRKLDKLKGGGELRGWGDFESFESLDRRKWHF